MQFNIGKFNRLLNNLGQQFDWRRRFACPCLMPGTNAPDPLCPQCEGTGHLWVAPLASSAAAAGQRTQQNWIQSGLYMSGDVVLTVPENSPMWDAGEFDRVDMLNAPIRFSETFRRGSPNELLRYRPISIERAFWLHPQSKAVVESSLPEVGEDGSLLWGEGAPPPGHYYTLSGMRPSQYYLYMDLPRTRSMHNGARMPKQIVVRRFELLNRNLA